MHVSDHPPGRQTLSKSRGPHSLCSLGIRVGFLSLVGRNLTLQPKSGHLGLTSDFGPGLVLLAATEETHVLDEQGSEISVKFLSRKHFEGTGV